MVMRGLEKVWTKGVRKSINVCLCVLMVLTSTAAVWLGSDPPECRAAQPMDGEYLDVVLVIDNSGSMAHNDPLGLRWSAARLFVDLAAPGDRVGALIFSTEVAPLGDAGEGRLTPMGGPAAAKQLKEYLSPREPDGGTNMNEALRRAEELLARDSVGNKPIVVFLTDGKPEPASQRPQLTDAIQEAGARGILVFPILLGPEAAGDVAAEMVAATGSITQRAADPRELLRAFGSVYAHAQPQRYVNQLNVRPQTTVEFQTNAAQAVTDIAVVIPRVDEEGDALRAATVDGRDVLGSGQLPGGAVVKPSESDHYEMLKVTHNAPLAGTWRIGLGETGGTGLLIVASQVVMGLLYPVPSKSESFVAPRVVPQGKEALLVSVVKRAGSRLADAEVVVTTDQGTIGLQSEGMSTNRTLHWGFLDTTSMPAGRPSPIELQVGQELKPFRLRKEFFLEPADVPVLVLDSPSDAQSGLTRGGKLHIKAHFEGGEVVQESVQGFVWGADAPGDVREVDLACVEQQCDDASLSLEPSRTYQVLVVGEARFAGRPYSDAALGTVSTDDVIRIDGLADAHDLGQIAPDDEPKSVPLVITAFTGARQPKLSVRLTKLKPRPPSAAVSIDLSPLRATRGNTYETQLVFRELSDLPSGRYTADVTFEADEADVTPAEAAFSFEIPASKLRVTQVTAPAARCGCPGWRDEPESPYLVDFGLLLDQTVQVDLAMEGAWLRGDPRVSVEVRDVHRVGTGSSVSDQVQVRAGTPAETGAQQYEMPLTMEVPEDLPPGKYVGELRLATRETAVAPDVLEFRFEKLSVLGMIRHWTRPARCFLVEWLSFRVGGFRVKVCFGWLTLLATAFLIISLTVTEGGMGNVTSGYDGSSARIGPAKPVFVLFDPADPRAGPVLTNDESASHRAVAEVWAEEGDIEPQVSVASGSGAVGQEVMLQVETARGRWRSLGPGGAQLPPSGQFRVVRDGQAYTFSLDI